MGNKNTKTNMPAVPSQGGSSRATPIGAVTRMNESIQTLDKREAYLAKKARECLKNALQHKTSNRKKALYFMKRKKFHDREIERIGQMRISLFQQLSTLESATMNSQVVNAMQQGVNTMKSMVGTHSVDKVENIREQIEEQSDDLRDVRALLAEPMGVMATIDDDDLEKEYNDLLREDEDDADRAAAPVEQFDLPVAPTTDPLSEQEKAALDELEEMMAS
jgi:charged multivesicular body protein 4